MTKEEFVAAYGGIYEHSPWVAEIAWQELKSHTPSVEELAQTMKDIVEKAERQEKLALIRSHPDLAVGKSALSTLTESSQGEQQSAGLDQCTEEEFERFQDLNMHYRQKFDFPFVLAVKGRNRSQILQIFESRANNTPDQEFETAMREIHKIARLRLDALLGSSTD